MPKLSLKIPALADTAAAQIHQQLSGLLFLEAIQYFPYLCSGISCKEGNEDRSLLLLPTMNTAIQTKLVEQTLTDLIAEDPGYFLVEIKIAPGNHVKVYVDADQGASIDRLVHYNRALYRRLEEEGVFPGNDFSLEVSSPGLEEPLKLQRQYVKNIGRYVEVTRTDGVKNEGKLLAVQPDGIVVEEEKGKTGQGKPKGGKKELVQHEISFDNIKTTKIQVKF